MATVKAGYDNSLDFDPASGIIKYGSYEFFANQVVTPTVQKLTIDNYLESKNYRAMQNAPVMGLANKLYGVNTPVKPDSKTYAEFEKAVTSGAFRGFDKAAFENRSTIDQDFNIKKQGWADFSGNAVREYNKLEDGSFEVKNYAIPSDINFVNELNKKAVNLNANAAMGQVSDSQRPVGGTSRLGKPNYSRAASILSGEASPLGGSSNPLGGLKTTLGS